MAKLMLKLMPHLEMPGNCDKTLANFQGERLSWTLDYVNFHQKNVLDIVEKVREASQASQASQALRGFTGLAFQSLRMLLLRRSRIMAA